MPIDPFLKSLLAEVPPFSDQIPDLDAWRADIQTQVDALTRQFGQPGPEVKERLDFVLPVEGGSVKLRVYKPSGHGPHPVHLYFHGGGWAQGSIEFDYIDVLCRERSVGADCVVVTVDYRKAPEHKFPTALDDCYAALNWVIGNADELGVRPDLITIGGGSAGGNLAAALALKVRDEGGPAIALQLLEVPALDLTLSSPSYREYAEGYMITLPEIKMYVRWYVPTPEEVTNPYVSPLLAPDLSGLPRTHIMSSEFDPIRGDGERYAERLQQAGVPATFSLQPGHIHASSPFTAVMPASRAWREEVLTTLRAAHQLQNAARP
ncbi:alpha/beta hydrolase [Paenarthrobacter sp. 22069]|uniref:alpha/beta hydrolase n=1 Tax=Paenarthrobacter sp. 22069 TaxID=3453864 RepID=UPI003F845981